MIGGKIFEVVVEGEEGEINRDEERLFVVELVFWDVGVNVEDAAAQFVGGQVGGGGFDQSGELTRHGVETLLELSSVAENDLLAEMIAVDEDLGLGVSLGHHDDHSILQGHRQPEFRHGLFDELAVALDDHVVGGLHV